MRSNSNNKSHTTFGHFYEFISTLCRLVSFGSSHSLRLWLRSFRITFHLSYNRISLTPTITKNSMRKKIARNERQSKMVSFFSFAGVRFSIVELFCGFDKLTFINICNFICRFFLSFSLNCQSFTNKNNNNASRQCRVQSAQNLARVKCHWPIILASRSEREGKQRDETTTTTAKKVSTVHNHFPMGFRFCIRNIEVMHKYAICETFRSAG